MREDRFQRQKRRRQTDTQLNRAVAATERIGVDDRVVTTALMNAMNTAGIAASATVISGAASSARPLDAAGTALADWDCRAAGASNNAS